MLSNLKGHSAKKQKSKARNLKTSVENQFVLSFKDLISARLPFMSKYLDHLHLGEPKITSVKEIDLENKFAHQHFHFNARSYVDQRLSVALQDFVKKNRVTIFFHTGSQAEAMDYHFIREFLFVGPNLIVARQALESPQSEEMQGLLKNTHSVSKSDFPLLFIKLICQRDETGHFHSQNHQS